MKFKATQYVCIQTYADRPPGMRHDTFAFTMRESKAKLIGGGTFTWTEAKKYGWICIKVQMTVVPLESAIAFEEEIRKEAVKPLVEALQEIKHKCAGEIYQIADKAIKTAKQ